MGPAVFPDVTLLPTRVAGPGLSPAQTSFNSDLATSTYLSDRLSLSLLSLLYDLPPDRYPSLLLFFLANSSFASLIAAFNFLSSSSFSQRGSAMYLLTVYQLC